MSSPEPTPAPEEGEGRRLARRAGTVASFTLGSRILGYVRDATMAYVFGAGVATDAFVAAHTIPNVLRRFVAEGTLVIAFVPLLTEEQGRGGLPAMRRFTAAVLGALLPLLVGLVAVGLLFPGVALDLFASGFDASRAELGTELTRWMMPYLFFISLVAVAGGALNTVGVFAAPAAAPILLNLCIIAAILGLSGRIEPPILAAAIGVTVGGLAQLALQVPYLAKRGLLVAPRWEPNHPSLRLLVRRMLPAVFGVGVYQLNMIVIRQLASFLPDGQLSQYFFASRLQEFALGVFAVSISVAALPTLSQHAARKDAKAVFATFGRAARATSFLTVPATAGLLVLTDPIVGTLFRHGAFGADDALGTSALVRIMAIALVPIGAVRVMVPTYYAVGDTRTPVLAATVSLLSTAGLGFVLSERFEIGGLTAATTLAATFQMVLLGGLFARRIRAALGVEVEGSGLGRLFPHAIRCVAAVLPGALLCFWLASLGTWMDGAIVVNALSLMGLGVLLIGLYFGFSRLLRIEEGALILGAVTRKLGRARPG